MGLNERIVKLDKSSDEELHVKMYSFTLPNRVVSKLVLLLRLEICVISFGI